MESLQNMEYQTHKLSNGLRIIHKYDQGAVAYCGMVINTGSRDETDQEQGLAHFVEHMLFKGTSRRRSGHIINRLENVGGELNAFTSKEETVVYAAVLREHLEKAVDLIGDIVFNSTFPEKELEKERVIILDEIQSYLDSPSEQIYDDFEEILFDHHPIGHNILGRPDLLEHYHASDLRAFVDRQYRPENMVFFVLGEIDMKKVIRMAERYFVCRGNNSTPLQRTAPEAYPVGRQQTAKDTFQVHFMLGGRAYDLQHPDRMGMYLLNNILGGPGMNSLLNLSLREKNGLVYTVESSYQPMSDTGMWSVYFGCDASNFARCERLVRLELKKLREQLIPEKQLKKYQYQLLGQMAISSEQKENLAISLGKSLLRFDKVDPMETVRAHIMELTAEKLRDIANELFVEEKISTLKYC